MSWFVSSLNPRLRMFRLLGGLALLLVWFLPLSTQAELVNLYFYMGWGADDISGFTSDDPNGLYSYEAYKALGFGEGAVVQVIVAQSSALDYTPGEASGNAGLNHWFNEGFGADLPTDITDYGIIQPNNLDPEDHFEYTYGTGDPETDPFDPTTTKPGQLIVETTTMNLVEDGEYSFLELTTVVDDIYFEQLGYDILYIRVFATNEFGEISSIIWGISAIYEYSKNEVGQAHEIWLIGITHTDNLFEVIPEPGTVALFGTGAATLFAAAHRRRKKKRLAQAQADSMETISPQGEVEERDSS